MGYLGVWTLVQHLEGYDVSEGGKDLQHRRVRRDDDNIDDRTRRELFVPEMQAKRTIDAPKYKKKS